MPRGGKRPGSGRKPGSANKRSRAIADKAAADGITPLEVMLNTMKALWEEATKDDKFDVEKALAACAVGKDAAPYMHPRMQQIVAEIDVQERPPYAKDYNLMILEKARAAGKADCEKVPPDDNPMTH